MSWKEPQKSALPTPSFQEAGSRPREELHAQCHIAGHRPSGTPLPATIPTGLTPLEVLCSSFLRPALCALSQLTGDGCLCTSSVPVTTPSPTGGLICSNWLPLLQVFGIMEQAKKDYMLEDYSISQVSLEDIFLSFTSPVSSTEGQFQQGQAVLASPSSPSHSISPPSSSPSYQPPPPPSPPPLEPIPL